MERLATLVRLVTYLSIGLAITLATLGHGAWHEPTVTILNVVVELFSGAHVTP